MKNKYTIILIPPDHSDAHQFQVSRRGKRILGGALLCFTVLVIGLFAQNLYLSHYIKERQPTNDQIDQLKSALVQRDQEITHLNEMSSQINKDLKSIKDLEDKFTSILKISPTSTSSTLSRGIDTTAQSLEGSYSASTLDSQAPIVTQHLALLQHYYEVASEQQDLLDHTPTMLPIAGEITSTFGYRRNPFGGRSSEFHNGIDIACNYGTPVPATAAGVVTFAGRDPVYGLKVVIDHGHGVATFYGHNSRLLVKKGDLVNKSQLIAYSGNTGRSTGSHLHYGAIVNGENVDPLTFTTLTKEEVPDV